MNRRIHLIGVCVAALLALSAGAAAAVAFLGEPATNPIEALLTR